MGWGCPCVFIHTYAMLHTWRPEVNFCSLLPLWGSQNWTQMSHMVVMAFIYSVISWALGCVFPEWVWKKINCCWIYWHRLFSNISINSFNTCRICIHVIYLLLGVTDILSEALTLTLSCSVTPSLPLPPPNHPHLSSADLGSWHIEKKASQLKTLPALD